jgi:hypothetical protein
MSRTLGIVSRAILRYSEKTNLAVRKFLVKNYIQKYAAGQTAANFLDLGSQSTAFFATSPDILALAAVSPVHPDPQRKLSVARFRFA